MSQNAFFEFFFNITGFWLYIMLSDFVFFMGFLCLQICVSVFAYVSCAFTLDLFAVRLFCFVLFGCVLF